MGYNMTNSSLTVPQLKKIYSDEMKALGYTNADLDCIFERCCSNKRFFPNSRKKHVVDERTYINDWILKYMAEISNLPSDRKAKKKKACSDPAVKTLIDETKRGATSTDRLLKYHELFMEAENCLGGLLEEYIYTKAKLKGAELSWCVGKCVKGVDFCTKNGDEIQIKNKYNTENSSSKNARNELGVAIWFRIKGTDKLGNPVFNWDELNSKLEGMCPPIKFNLSESDFRDFLISCARKNKNILY